MNQHTCTTIDTPFRPLAVAVLTVSDTRSEADDLSGRVLIDRLANAGHRLAARAIAPDHVHKLRAVVTPWIADETIDVVLVTGGSGPTGRDLTPEALKPLLDKELDGFGELFRWFSYRDVGTAAVQSRAFAGVANATLIVALPGSPGACKTAWDYILKEQLDSRHGPCNFVTLLPRLNEV